MLYKFFSDNVRAKNFARANSHFARAKIKKTSEINNIARIY